MLEDTGMVDAQAFDGDAHTPSPEVSYFRKSEIEQLRSVLRSLVDRLTEQQRLVIRHHYLQEAPFDDIAAMMGVTRGAFPSCTDKPCCDCGTCSPAKRASMSHYDFVTRYSNSISLPSLHLTPHDRYAQHLDILCSAT